MATTYTLISSNVLSSTAGSVTFSSIPATYTDLVIRASARTDFTGTNDQMGFRLGVTSSVYSTTSLQGNGASASSSRTSGNSYGGLAATGSNINANGSTSNTFGSWELYVPNYNSSTTKPSSIFACQENNNATAFISINAELMNNTSAVTSITLIGGNGNFVSGCSFYLYGISNA